MRRRRGGTLGVVSSSKYYQSIVVISGYGPALFFLNLNASKWTCMGHSDSQSRGLAFFCWRAAIVGLTAVGVLRFTTVTQLPFFNLGVSDSGIWQPQAHTTRSLRSMENGSYELKNNQNIRHFFRTRHEQFRTPFIIAEAAAAAHSSSDDQSGSPHPADCSPSAATRTPASHAYRIMSDSGH